VLGTLLIYVELVAPGRIAPGVIGATLVLLGLSAISVLPVHWLGAGLLVLAMALFAVEAKFVTHGLSAVAGGVAMVLGAVLLIDSPDAGMRVRWGTAVALAVPFAAITRLLVSLAARARRNKAETGSGSLGRSI
jgi:membrane-bound serine protease (ClpP class)